MLDCLRELGCDTDGAMERFLEDEDFYWECFDKFVEDGEIESLGQLLLVNDVEEAFSTAHSLKGTLGNLGLTPLYDIMVTIVEPLREGRIDGVPEKYENLIKKWSLFKGLHKK